MIFISMPSNPSKHPSHIRKNFQSGAGEQSFEDAASIDFKGRKIAGNRPASKGEKFMPLDYFRITTG